MPGGAAWRKQGPANLMLNTSSLQIIIRWALATFDHTVVTWPANQSVINTGEGNLHQNPLNGFWLLPDPPQHRLAMARRCWHKSSALRVCWLSTSSSASGSDRPLITRICG